MKNSLLNKFLHASYNPVTEGFTEKYLGFWMKAGQVGGKLVKGGEADKRDSETKIVLISEANLKNHDWNKPLYAWNPEDYKHIAVYYGIVRMYSQFHADITKKLLIVSEAFWNNHADDKIIIFKVKRADCKKGKNIVTHPCVTWLYTTKKANLKIQSKTTTIRGIVKELGFKVATPANGPLKPGKTLKV